MIKSLEKRKNKLHLKNTSLKIIFIHIMTQIIYHDITSFILVSYQVSLTKPSFLVLDAEVEMWQHVKTRREKLETGGHDG